MSGVASSISGSVESFEGDEERVKELLLTLPPPRFKSVTELTSETSETSSAQRRTARQTRCGCQPWEPR